MKVIQITACPVANTHATQCDWMIHALTDTGRLFAATSTHGWQEIELPPGCTPEPQSAAQEDGK